MEIGVISDGISRDFKYSVSVIKEYNIKHVELQYIDKKEVGDLTKKEQIEVKKIIKNKTRGNTENSPNAANHPITGGKAPAAPPITIFWAVVLFSQIV